MKSLSLHIATVNGSGSLSANQLLTKILFRSGWAVGSYNFFPSNIAGLPCLYSLRLSSEGWTGFSSSADVLISLNPKSFLDSLKALKPKGLLVLDEKDKGVLSGLKTGDSLLNDKKPLGFKGLVWPMPFSGALKNLSGLSPKTRPLLKNMIYVGMASEWLKADNSLVQKSAEDLFKAAKSPEILKKNRQAIQIGRELALKRPFPFPIQKPPRPKSKTALKKDKGQSLSSAGAKETKSLWPNSFLSKGRRESQEILIDGNTSMALGALFAGCQFVSWYPITPASSLAENFEKFANAHQKDPEGKKKFLVMQAEDELAAVSQAIGAGWTGLRAMTVTSGPGLSLMSEGAGLSYFAEIPVVLCAIQRAGPSTGLPTRTQQGDLLASCFLSHGGCKHIALLPGAPEEAFYMTMKAFDLAESLQTLVIVLSDLDLGMNLRMSRAFHAEDQPLKRGKVLREKDLENLEFAPYQDIDGDGLSYRTLPGVRHPKGAYLNRGSGHNQKAEYSEKPEDYSWKLDKLERKWQSVKKLMPEPVMEALPERDIAFVTFGPNEESVKELRGLLEKQNILTNFMRIRSFPFPPSIGRFLEKQSEIFVVEQNRDGQLKQLLSGEFPRSAPKMRSLLQYDGRPLEAQLIKKQFDKLYRKIDLRPA